MIFGISGRPGGGKSYEAVKNHIIPVLKEGRKVVTNLPLNIEHIKHTLGHQAAELVVLVDGKFHNFGDKDRPFSKAKHFLQFEGWQNDKGQGPAFFIDECHLVMPAGATEKELLELLSMHRHYVFDIYLISQDFRKIHRDILAMIEINYRCIKKTALGRTDAYIMKVCQGGYTNSEVVNTYEREYEPWVFEFYKSHTKTNAAKVEEALTKEIKPWWKQKKVIAGCVFVPVGLFIIVASVSKFSSQNQHKQAQITKQEAPQQQITQQPNPTQQPSQVSTPKPQPEKKQYTEDAYHPLKHVSLHVAGVYRDRKEKKAYFTVALNGQPVNEIDSVDLMMSGYQVLILSDCVVRIRFEEYQSFVICDSPQISQNAALDSTGVTAAASPITGAMN